VRDGEKKIEREPRQRWGDRRRDREAKRQEKRKGGIRKEEKRDRKFEG
jgi:hypothetical protein